MRWRLRLISRRRILKTFIYKNSQQKKRQHMWHTLPCHSFPFIFFYGRWKLILRFFFPTIIQDIKWNCLSIYFIIRLIQIYNFRSRMKISIIWKWTKGFKHFCSNDENFSFYLQFHIWKKIWHWDGEFMTQTIWGKNHDRKLNHHLLLFLSQS